MEGLNQEIERIVLKTDSDIHNSRSDDFCKSSLITPEGHRAPLAEILRQSRSRSVNTQTPQDFESFSSSSGKCVIFYFMVGIKMLRNITYSSDSQTIIVNIFV